MLPLCLLLCLVSTGVLLSTAQECHRPADVWLSESSRTARAVIPQDTCFKSKVPKKHRSPRSVVYQYKDAQAGITAGNRVARTPRTIKIQNNPIPVADEVNSGREKYYKRAVSSSVMTNNPPHDAQSLHRFSTKNGFQEESSTKELTGKKIPPTLVFSRTRYCPHCNHVLPPEPVMFQHPIPPGLYQQLQQNPQLMSDKMMAKYMGKSRHSEEVCPYSQGVQEEQPQVVKDVPPSLGGGQASTQGRIEEGQVRALQNSYKKTANVNNRTIQTPPNQPQVAPRTGVPEEVDNQNPAQISLTHIISEFPKDSQPSRSQLPAPASGFQPQFQPRPPMSGVPATPPVHEPPAAPETQEPQQNSGYQTISGKPSPPHDGVIQEDDKL